MSNSNILLNLLESILGTGDKTSKGNYKFHCPNCHHPKKKLEINIQTNQNKENPWNCWICGNKDNFKGKTIKSLFKKIKVPQSKFNELKYIISPGENISPNYNSVYELSLPKEYISLSNLDNISKYDLIIAKHVINYLKTERKLTKEDIIRYNIGFCSSGKYSNKIIIPSYDGEGKLNFFIGRNYEGEFSGYVNPPIPNDNIIGFEYFINWNLPVILCEGVFDSISIKRNSIPLFGKKISKTLMKKLIQSNIEKIYLALDSDALEDTLINSEMLMHYGKKVYIVELNGKDPNQIGFEQFTHIIQNTYPLDFKKLYSFKINL